MSNYIDLPVEGGSSGVISLNGLVGALTLVAGANITITPSGTNITIASTGGGGGITSINTDSTAAQLLTVGTSGTDFAITNPGSGSHVLNLPTASASNRGALSSADWSTFNSKQAAGSYITALTGDATASGPGSVALTLATVNANVGSFGIAASVGTFTVNAKGLITAASNTAILIAESQVTNLVSDLAGKQAIGNYLTALTGDGTASGPGSAALTLATVNVTTGTYGTATSVGTFTVNGKGLVTASSATAIQITEAQVTNLTTDLAAKANTALSNLASTAVNVDIIPVNTSINLGSTSLPFAITNTANLLNPTAGGNSTYHTQNTTGSTNSGVLSLATGNMENGTSGDLHLFTGGESGAGTTGSTGTITMATGNANGGGASGGVSGNVLIQCGSATRINGYISMTGASLLQIPVFANDADNTTGSGGALPGAPRGSLYFNSGSKAYRFHNGTAWAYLNQAPTIQKFTSSSGTYTTPAGVAYIKVRLVGGGGGGAGSSTVAGADGGAGGTGGNTTFGSSLLTGNGGVGGTSGGTANGGAGGTASLGSGPVGLNLTGGGGGGASQSVASNTISGGKGASSAFGGGGAGSSVAGVTNTGGGGGGASAPATGISGSGGGSGGYVDAIITGPSATYAYAVGAAGTLGSAGTGGTAGAAGGSGVIIVEEHYY